MARRTIPADVIGQTQAMVRSGMSIKKTAEIQGLSRDTVARYSRGETPASVDMPSIEEAEHRVTKRIKDNLDSFLVKATDLMAEDAFVLEMAKKPKDLAIGVGIVSEKRELLAGRPTGRSESTKIVYLAPTALAELSAVPESATPALDSGAIEGQFVEKQD